CGIDSRRRACARAPVLIGGRVLAAAARFACHHQGSLARFDRAAVRLAYGQAAMGSRWRSATRWAGAVPLSESVQRDLMRIQQHEIGTRSGVRSARMLPAM